MTEVLEKQYTRLFNGSPLLLKSEALHSRLQYAPIRTLAWMTFLNILPRDKDMESWQQILINSRQAYQTVKEKHQVNPRDENGPKEKLNPLSREKDSKWTIYFENERLKKKIEQDILRTYPEYDFFKDEIVAQTMTDILFLYAKEYPDVAYNQGMHEILAVVYFLVYHESVEYDELVPVTFFFDRDYIEDTVWILFHAILDVMVGWFLAGTDTPIILKCESIHNSLIGQADMELSRHIEQFGIVPQSYLLRWLRIMFGREFSLEDTMAIWDAIFAFDDSFSLVDHIATAMILAIKEEMMESDSNGVLTLLFRYPSSSVSVQDILETAVKLATGTYFKKKPKVISAQRNQNYAGTTNIPVPKPKPRLAPLNRDEIGDRLEIIATVLQTQLFGSPDLVEKIPDSIFVAITELKQIRTVIKDGLPMELLTPIDQLKLNTQNN